MRITKVYTRTGDDGTTGLADGSRISKSSLRLDTYGTIDELNSIMGICYEHASHLENDKSRILKEWICAIQNDLFNLGGDLATPLESRWNNMIVMEQRDILQLEKMIDKCQDHLSPLSEFVLPGGSPLNAYFHLARTVCRRAERHCVSLALTHDINPHATSYLNRLSDLFFVLSRWVLDGAPEVTWSKTKGVRELKI